jgi:hypothetical protein
MGNKAPSVKYVKAFEFFGRRSGGESLFETITAYDGGKARCSARAIISPIAAMPAL